MTEPGDAAAAPTGGEPVFCPRCGHANAAGAHFCGQCGAGLDREGSPAAGPERPPAERPGETTSTVSLAGLESALDGGDGDAIDVDGAVEEISGATAVEALPAGSALLVVKRGPNAGSRFLLDAEVTTAGRHPESDIFLDDVTVSRRHAEFRRRPGGEGFEVVDVGSLNGTYLNRERIDEAALAGGDEVQIGKFRLVYLTSAEADAEARPAAQ